MELSAIEHLVYGFVSGMTEILPVSERAHSALLLKILGQMESAICRFF